MKCKYCGGEVGLEELVCPYCGQPNDQAVLHQKDMAAYRQRFHATETAVRQKAHQYSQIIPRVVLILTLLIGGIIMLAISSEAYYFPEAARHRAAMRHPDQTRQTLERCLEEGDYISFSSWMEYNDISYYSDFPEYEDVGSCAYNYRYLLIRMEQLFLHADVESWTKDNAASEIHWFCESLDDFFENLELIERYSESPDYMEHVHIMRENVLGLLKVYFKIEENDLDAFLSLSSNRKAAFIEEVLLINA